MAFSFGPMTGGNTGINGGRPIGPITQAPSLPQSSGSQFGGINGGGFSTRTVGGVTYQVNPMGGISVLSPTKQLNAVQSQAIPQQVKPQTSSMAGLTAAAVGPSHSQQNPGMGSGGGGNTSYVPSGAGGATLPDEPPITSGAGNGGAPMIDSGIDRILGSMQGGDSMAGLLRSGLGSRSYPQDSFVLAGKKAY